MSETLHVYRSENKYIISLITMSQLTRKFDILLKKDENSVGSSYIVRSLYFDSINNIDYYGKLAGTKLRKKIRIRVYDPNDSRCKLEMKQKNGELQHKVSLWIDKEDVESLIHGKYNVLQKYFSKSKDAILIYTVMSQGLYKPVAMIEYDRVAYLYPRYNTRITFDYNIRSSESDFNLFNKKPMFNKLTSDKVVLEVKYNEKLMGFISDTLKPYNLSKVAISKYCIGRKVFQDFIF